MAAGSGNAAPADPRDILDLAAPEIEIGITAVERDGGTDPDLLRVRGLFNNLLETVGWNFRELGLYCQIDNDPEVLYSYVADTGAGDFFPPYDGQNAVILYPTMLVLISATIPINAVITVGADFNCENIGPETVGPGWYKERVGNLFRFKRAIAGTGIELIEDSADPFSITISQKTLTVDLDLFVRNGAPDVFPNFSNIQSAHDYLLDFFIPNDVTATISIDPDRFTFANAVIITHPQASQIIIQGAALPAPMACLPGTRTGTPGDYTMPITGLADTTGIAVGDVVFLNIGTGSAAPDWSWFVGAWKVVGPITANSISVTLTNRKDYAQLAGGLNGATLQRFPTQITFGNIGTTDAIRVQGGASLGSFRRLALFSDRAIHRSAIGILANSAINLEDIAINGWGGPAPANAGYGIRAENPGAIVSGNRVYVCNCSSGIWVRTGGNLQITPNGVCSGNQAHGIVSADGGIVTADGAITCGNGVNGLHNSLGTLFANGGRTTSNVECGVFCTNGAMSAFDKASGSTFAIARFNGDGNAAGPLTDFQAQRGGFITARFGNDFGFSVPNPPFNTVGIGGTYAGALIMAQPGALEEEPEVLPV
jgi:hypothetical protein